MAAEPTTAADDDRIDLADIGAVVGVRVRGAEPWREALSPLPARLVKRMRSAPAEPDVYGLLLRSQPAAPAPEPTAATAVGIDRQVLDVWSFERFSKPTVFLLDGVVDGAGAAFALAGTHRVAVGNFSLAFSGVSRGRLPEVGTLWRLRRLGTTGRYLALTGRSLTAAEALQLGLITHVGGADLLAPLMQRYCDAEPIDQLLDGLPLPAPPGDPASVLSPAMSSVIDCFAADDPGSIVERLAVIGGAASVAASEAAKLLSSQPPLAAAVSLRLLSESIVAADIVEASLRRDYALGKALAEVSNEPSGGEDLDVMVNEVLRRSVHQEISLPVLEIEPEPIG